MKLKIIAALFVMSLAASAQAAQDAPPSRQEAFCTALSNVAETAAQGKVQGITVQQASQGLAGATSALKAISYVYSQALSPKEAKAVVFAQCLAGSFR